MWFIESKGFRIGPDWYTEAGPFATEAAARAYATEHRNDLPAGDLRVVLDTD